MLSRVAASTQRGDHGERYRINKHHNLSMRCWLALRERGKVDVVSTRAWPLSRCQPDRLLQPEASQFAETGQPCDSLYDSQGVKTSGCETSCWHMTDHIMTTGNRSRETAAIGYHAQSLRRGLVNGWRGDHVRKRRSSGTPNAGCSRGGHRGRRDLAGLQNLRTSWILAVARNRRRYTRRECSSVVVSCLSGMASTPHRLTLQWSRHAAVPNPALRASKSADATASRPLQFAPSGYSISRGSGRAASPARHVGRAQHTGRTLGRPNEGKIGRWLLIHGPVDSHY